ncbi:MAG: peptidoglycan -binding protein [Alphaproteobacteria bacterium]|nr:peptidoglycan -binding protein [Alphaproteobacteria bacterium]MBV9555101.1 peptidoglycan -binding protein [Alphaproteobacteria bacterium]
MALARSRGRRSSIDIWPGFVDALAQLLMVIIFILLVFTVGQFYLSDALSGRDEALKELQQKISALADELALEKQTAETLRGNTASLAAQLKASEDARAQLNAKLAAAGSAAGALSDQTRDLQAKLAAEQQTSQAARVQVEQLTAEIASLRDQLAKVAAALDLSAAKVKEQQGQIVELGKKLNLALASKVEELARYRSEFFGKLSEILGNRSDIRVVGDRFVFQAEVLFAPGKAELAPEARQQLSPVFAALKEIAAKIPANIDWVLQVNGHTDHRPIHNTDFASNWELSTARAITVVRYAIDQGVPANHLSAAGFSDNQPIDTGDSEDAYKRNRRIELKLTER